MTDHLVDVVRTGRVSWNVWHKYISSHQTSQDSRWFVPLSSHGGRQHPPSVASNIQLSTRAPVTLPRRCFVSPFRCARRRRFATSWPPPARAGASARSRYSASSTPGASRRRPRPGRPPRAAAPPRALARTLWTRFSSPPRAPLPPPRPTHPRRPRPPPPSTSNTSPSSNRSFPKGPRRPRNAPAAPAAAPSARRTRPAAMSGFASSRVVSRLSSTVARAPAVGCANAKKRFSGLVEENRRRQRRLG